MKLIKTRNYKELSEKASEIVINQIKKKPNSIIAFATGSTPLGLYKELINAYRKKKVDFSKIKAFALDEYYPIKKSDKRSFHHYFFKNLFSKINVKKKNINLLNGEARDVEKECREYEAKIKRQKIDLQILGLGANGHIAFNEPGSCFSSRTRLVEVAPETIEEKKVPKKALTQGISTIISARKLLLVASGKKKAKAINCLINCKPDKCWPVSFLKKHKNLTVIVDKNAGRLI